jgi:hypothetical protein
MGSAVLGLGLNLLAWVSGNPMPGGWTLTINSVKTLKAGTLLHHR